MRSMRMYEEFGQFVETTWRPVVFRRRRLWIRKEVRPCHLPEISEDAEDQCELIVKVYHRGQLAGMAHMSPDLDSLFDQACHTFDTSLQPLSSGWVWECDVQSMNWMLPGKSTSRRLRPGIDVLLHGTNTFHNNWKGDHTCTGALSTILPPFYST